MKGVIFVELVGWVEHSFSPAVADAMITRADVGSGGAYSSVGYYAHQEALALLVTLAEMVDRPVAELARSYGSWLAGRFAVLYPEMFEGYGDAYSFLRDIDWHIHVEVQKLYPGARTPSILTATDGEQMTVSYSSHRPMADVAHGLIAGTLRHFGEDMDVERDPGIDSASQARFFIRPGTRATGG